MAADNVVVLSILILFKPEMKAETVLPFQAIEVSLVKLQAISGPVACRLRVTISDHVQLDYPPRLNSN